MMVWIMVKQPMIDHDVDKNAEELPADSGDDEVEDSSEA